LLCYCYIFSAVNQSEEHSDLILLQELQAVTDIEDGNISLSIQNESPFGKKSCDSGSLEYLLKIMP